MVRRYALSLSFLLLAPVTGAQADTAYDRSWYAGGGPALGNVFAVQGEGLFESSRRGSSDVGFIATAGYRWSRYLALEIAYLDGGAPRFTSIAAYPDASSPLYDTRIVQETTAFTGSVIGILPLGDRFELYLRAGAAFWDADADQRLTSLVDGNTIDRRIRDTGTDFMLAVGTGINVTPNWHVRLDYLAFRTGDELLALGSGREARFDSFSLQLFRRFGRK
jgi:OOP family OmpA-OmpF porin